MTIDEKTFGILSEYVSTLKKKFDIREAILFGSRVRGDFQNDSDYDLAIIVKNLDDKFGALRQMSDESFGIYANEKMFISPYPIDEAQWRDPGKHSNPDLIRNIKAEGIWL